MKVDIMKKFDAILESAKKHGITLNLKGGDPLVYDKGQPSNQVQKQVHQAYEDIVSKESKQAGMTRRQFLATPLCLTAAAMAISTGLGSMLYTSPAQANIFPSGNNTPSGPLDFICYGYPIVPNLSLTEDDFIDPQGKVALIIGGSSGMGRNAAEKLQQRGFTVIATSRTPNTIEPIPNVPIWKLDVTKQGSINRFVNKVKRHFNQVDLLHCNAGRVFLGRPLQSSRAAQRLCMETNAEGHITLIQKIYPLMPKEGYARILITSSIANHAYNAFKIPYPDDNSTDFIDFGSLSSPYNESKAQLSRFGAALVGEQLAASNPNLTQGDLKYPETPTNLTVSILHPLGVNTLTGGGLFDDLILGEKDGEYLEKIRDSFSILNEIGIDTPIAGDAFVQMALLKDTPYLHTIVADLTLSPADPNPLRQAQFFSQFIAMRAMAEQQEITIRSLTTPPFPGP